MSKSDKVAIALGAFIPWIFVGLFCLAFEPTAGMTVLQTSIKFVAPFWLLLSPFTTLLLINTALMASNKVNE